MKKVILFLASICFFFCLVGKLFWHDRMMMQRTISPSLYRKFPKMKTMLYGQNLLPFLVMNYMEQIWKT